jgi:hypothetical protein
MGVEQGQRSNKLNTRTTGATSKQTPNRDVLSTSTPYKTYSYNFFYLKYQWLLWLGLSIVVGVARTWNNNLYHELGRTPGSVHIDCYAPWLTQQVSILPFPSCTYGTIHRKNDPI